MSQTTWTRLAGPGTLVAPALSALGSSLCAAAVSPRGEVVTSQISTPGDGLSSWPVVGATGGRAALSAAPNTSPVLCHDGPNRLLLVCRGADDDLHVTSCRAGSGWETWKRLTHDGGVSGRISATVTESPWRLHVLYSGPGHTLHYRSFNSAWSAAGTTSWPDVREGVLAGDGTGELFCAHRSLDDRVTFVRLRAPWTGGWEPVVTRTGQPTRYHCQGLSNVVHHADAFHVLFVWATRQDLGEYHGIHHVRVRTGQYDDAYFLTVYDHITVTPRMPQISLSNYRNRLVAAFNDGDSDIRYAWLDDIDPSNRWVGGEIVASGQTTDRVALAACDFRSAPASSEFGDDLFALVRGRTGAFVYFINFSRTFFMHRLHSIGHRVDWCTAHPGTMANCHADSTLPAVEEVPVYSEIGAGTMGLPDALMREIFPRVMTHAKHAGQDYMAWVHNELLPEGAAYFGPHMNLDTHHSSDDWHHEMLHRLLTSLRVVNDDARAANPNLMQDFLSDSLVADGAKLFGRFTNSALDCTLGKDGPRCRGFVNSGGYNYDVQDRQHAFIGVIGWYLRGGQRVRDDAYSDLRAGADLLWQKYCWVRTHLFGGVEFGEAYTPIQVVTIRNAHSGKVLDVRGWDLEDHAPLQQYPFHGGDNQRFHLRQLPKGYVQLVAMHSGKALDVAGLSSNDGAAVQQYSRSAGHNQQWRLFPDGSGAYEIVARHSGKCLEVVNWSTSDGAKVAQYGRHGGANQKWRLED